MYPTPPGNQSTSMRIAIREVNMIESYITGIDAFGKSYQISLDLLDPLVAIPMINEMWVVIRRGNNWILDKRIETGTEQKSIKTLAPGDRRLEAPNKIYLIGNQIIVNGVDLLAKLESLQAQINTLLP